MMLDVDGLVLGPETVPCPWEDVVLRLDGAAYGWGSPEEGRHLCRELRDDVRYAVERLQDGVRAAS